MIGIYRNYNVKEDLLLECSGWESQAMNLNQFMERVKVDGGVKEEAIEVGLQLANYQHQIQSITQIILLGDAPVHSHEKAMYKRQAFLGEEYW